MSHDLLPGEIDVASQVKNPHNLRLYTEIQKLKDRINTIVDYQLAHPKSPNPTTTDLEEEKKVQREIATQEKHVRAQLAVVKTLYRQSVLKLREEKTKTSEDRAVVDALILGLGNLKYEEQSLQKEIKGAEDYDHKYTKLDLIGQEDFLQQFPHHADSSDHDLMIARIEHEREMRVQLEDRRQEKLKQKQELHAKVKKGKDNLTKLDGMVEVFIEAAVPIRELLDSEYN